MFTFGEVILSKMGEYDLQWLLKLKQESWFGTHSVSLINEEDQQRWFDSMPQDTIAPKSLILMASVVGKPELCRCGVVKLTNIHWVNRTVDMAWDLFDFARGQKLGKPLVKAGVAFCFELLNLRRIDAEILDLNIPSQKCAAAAGFRHEGVRRDAVERQGACFDSNVYGILSHEWFYENQRTSELFNRYSDGNAKTAEPH